MNAHEDSQFPLVLKAPGSGGPLSMSSEEIAELTEKLHKNVIRDIRAMLVGLYGSDGQTFEEMLKDGSVLSHLEKSVTWEMDNRGYVTRFHLDKEHSFTLVAGYDVQLRNRVVRRWLKLEEVVAHPVDPIEALRDPVTLRALLLQHTEERLKLETENKALGVKAETLARLEGSDDLFGVRITAKLVQMPERKFVEWVQQIKWVYRQTGSKALLCYADKRQAGFCRLVPKEYEKQDGSTGVRETLKFTMKGVVRLAAMLNIKLSEEDLFAARGEG
ncbi:phage antirepressor KilAC domain-containing protein [Xanthobacter sediminis]